MKHPYSLRALLLPSVSQGLLGHLSTMETHRGALRFPSQIRAYLHSVEVKPWRAAYIGVMPLLGDS